MYEHSPINPFPSSLLRTSLLPMPKTSFRGALARRNLFSIVTRFLATLEMTIRLSFFHELPESVAFGQVAGGRQGLLPMHVANS